MPCKMNVLNVFKARGRRLGEYDEKIFFLKIAIPI
jgi:hypothetical protein